MPDYRIDLDPHNPGQFLACCGLFELAELPAPGAQAAFENAGETFVLNTNSDLPSLHFEILPPGTFADKTLEPLTIVFAGKELALTWWLNETHTDKSALKTWGGQQTPRRVLEELLGHLHPLESLNETLNQSVYIKSRFGVDARSAWDALDAGYSPNDIGQAAATFPWIEVLAMIGLQGFRPQQQKKRSLYHYTAWQEPLPISVARAACSVPWTGLTASTFEFEIAFRGQGYKTFLFAKGANHV